MARGPRKLAILVGGGPAPGINSVIGAATIRANLEGIPVVGIEDGFRWLMRGDVTHVRDLTTEAVSRIHFRGGSHLGTARDNPTREERDLEAVVAGLLQLDVDKLVTIGGDDTAFSAMRIADRAEGRLHVAHVPKTIDNDLDLPHGIPTFGFQTARHLGVDIVRNLMVDARSTHRWYVVVSMGRQAGHLALGVAKAAGATLAIIPEEFFPGDPIRLSHVADILVGAILKRRSYGRRDGVAVLAEGIAERLDASDLEGLDSIERDAHGHPRLSEVDLGDVVKRRARDRLDELGVETTISVTRIGYELRCADPIPFDMEYTRDLGFCAAQFLLDGGSDAVISIQNGRFVPIRFEEIVDPLTGRMRVRAVDVESESYAIARRYMLRLNRGDFEDAHELARLAAIAGLDVDAFRARFGYLIEKDRLYALPEKRASAAALRR